MTNGQRLRNERHRSLPGAPRIAKRKEPRVWLGYTVSDKDRARRSEQMKAYWQRIREKRNERSNTAHA